MVDELFEGVGINSRVDHAAVQTAFGMLIAATTLFEKLGYSVDPDRKAGGDWGKAIFLVKDGSIPIQLTDSSAGLSVPTCENHIAIVVDDPRTVADQIQQWAGLGGDSAEVEGVPGNKYFVVAPKILTMPIELVPSPNTCPACGGRGTTRRGREGMGYDSKCGYCRGSGQDPHCR